MANRNLIDLTRSIELRGPLLTFSLLLVHNFLLVFGAFLIELAPEYLVQFRLRVDYLFLIKESDDVCLGHSIDFVDEILSEGALLSHRQWHRSLQAYELILSEIFFLFDPSILEIIFRHDLHPHLVLLVRVVIVAHHKGILVLVGRHGLVRFVVLEIFCVKLVEFFLRVYFVVNICVFFKGRRVGELVCAFDEETPVAETVFLAPDEDGMRLEGKLGGWFWLVVFGKLCSELLEMKTVFFCGLAGAHIDALRPPLALQLIENAIQLFIITSLEQIRRLGVSSSPALEIVVHQSVHFGFFGLEEEKHIFLGNRYALGAHIFSLIGAPILHLFNEGVVVLFGLLELHVEVVNLEQVLLKGL